jgi:hypothetical protein
MRTFPQYLTPDEPRHWPIFLNHILTRKGCAGFFIPPAASELGAADSITDEGLTSYRRYVRHQSSAPMAATRRP